MKKVYYFQHDYNPTNDPKIICLLGNYGGLGYGVYWRIIEMLHEEEIHKLPFKIYIFEAIAKQMLANAKQIEAIINDCIKYELLEKNDTLFWSNRVLKNIERQQEISIKRADSGRIGGKAKQMLSKTKQNVAKERKGKEIKINYNINTNTVLSDDNNINKEIVSIFDEFKKINPSTNYGNKTQREAIKWLIKEYGFEKALGTARYAISIQGKEYSPVITTPYQLKEKIASLMIFYEKQPKIFK